MMITDVSVWINLVCNYRFKGEQFNRFYPEMSRWLRLITLPRDQCESLTGLLSNPLITSRMKDKFPPNVTGYRNVHISNTVWLQRQIKFTGLNYAMLNLPIYMTFLWWIQSRLANQHSITKLLHGGSLIGFNLHNGRTLRMWGLNCFPFLHRAD